MADTKASAFTAQTAFAAGTDLIPYVHNAAVTPANAVITVTNLAADLVANFSIVDLTTAQTLTTKTLTSPTINGATIGAAGMDFTPNPTPSAHTEGRLEYNDVDKCLTFFNDEAEITLNIGQENWIRVYNNTGATITNGSPVYVTGTEGVENRATVADAQADAVATAAVVGIATHDIETASFGYITQFGRINDLNTASFTAGDLLYLSATTAGGLTNSEPITPNASVFLGYCLVSNASTGAIFITTLGNTGRSVGQAQTVELKCRKNSAGTITAGTPVYIAGYNAGNESVLVEACDASAAATMPAIGIARESFTNGTDGFVVQNGIVRDVIDTSSWSVNDSVYVSETSGQLTNVRPTTSGAEIQAIGRVLRVSATVGAVELVGAGRSNDIPRTTANTLEMTGLLDVTGGTMRAPLSATPTMAVDGDFAIDTTVTDFSHGILKYYDGEEMGVVAMPIAQFTTPTNGYVVGYNATTDEFELVANGGGGTATREIFIQASAFNFPATSGAYRDNEELTTNDVQLEYVHFANGSTTYAQFPWVPNKAWDAGTFTVKFHWYSNIASGNIVWQVDALSVGDNDAMDRTWGTAQTVTDGSNATDDLNVSAATAAVTASGTPAKGDMIMLRIARLGGDASDTLVGNAYLLGITVTYTEDASDDS